MFKLIKKIGIILGLSLSLCIFMVLLWITTEGEFNPPSLKKIFFWSTVFSTIMYFLHKYVENNSDKITKFLEKYK